MLRIKIIAPLLLCLVASFQAKASLIWEWSFVESDLYVQPGDTINLEVVVRNSALSDTNLNTSMISYDGSWGDLGNGPSYVTAIVSQNFSNLAPGQESQFLAATIIPRSNDNSGDILTVNPIMYGIEYPALIGITERMAIAPLVVHVAAVPLPPTVWLLGSGIVSMLGLGRVRKPGNMRHT